MGKTKSSRRDQDSRCNRIKSIDVIKSIDARQEREKTYRLQCRRSLIALVAGGGRVPRCRRVGRDIWVIRLFRHGSGKARGVKRRFVVATDFRRRSLEFQVSLVKDASVVDFSNEQEQRWGKNRRRQKGNRGN